MAITLRTVTGSALTHTQADINFSSFFYSASLSGSNLVLYTTGSSIIGVTPSTTTIPLTSSLLQWTDVTGGSIRRVSDVSVTGSFGVTGSVTFAGNSNTSGSVVISGSLINGISITGVGINAHAEGNTTHAGGTGAHSEGYFTSASGTYSHAEGVNTLASSSGAHAEGSNTQAIGIGSHTQGYYTVASGSYQNVMGQYNISSSDQSAIIIGNGTAAAARSNLLFASGSVVQITGSVLIKDILTLAPRTTTPTGIASGSFIVSGSGATIKPYFWDGSTWNALY